MHDGGIKAYGTPEEVLTEQNIADVFGVSSELIKATENSPLRILINDEIIKFDNTDEQEVDDNE
jgi:ABC-type cobalamin/Fe3+-siderophores transport system ATPase subunit